MPFFAKYSQKHLFPAVCKINIQSIKEQYS